MTTDEEIKNLYAHIGNLINIRDKYSENGQMRMAKMFNEKIIKQRRLLDELEEKKNAKKWWQFWK